MAWKYVTFEVVALTAQGEAVAFKVPVLFPPELNHKAMADVVIRAFSSDRKHAKPVAAGFVEFFPTVHGRVGMRTYGVSESLNMEPHADDGRIIYDVQRRDPFYYPGC